MPEPAPPAGAAPPGRVPSMARRRQLPARSSPGPARPKRRCGRKGAGPAARATVMSSAAPPIAERGAEGGRASLPPPPRHAVSAPPCGEEVAVLQGEGGRGGTARDVKACGAVREPDRATGLHGASCSRVQT